MKKFITLGFATLLVGCENPSLERGLDNLRSTLSDLEAQILNVDAETITNQLNAMSAQVSELEDQNAEVVEVYNQLLSDLSNTKEKLQEISYDGFLSNVDEVKEKLEEVKEKIRQLDLDGDSIMNYFDECPETAEGAEVDPFGCSEEQKTEG